MSPATVCIAGGGPAGMVAGLLLARQGVRVTVIEKHADFLRDFRGDTIHPSTLQVFAELGLLDALLERPHSRVENFAAVFEGRRYRVADLSRLPVRCRFVALMPQWDLLDFIAAEARRYPCFALCMSTAGTGLIRDGSRVAGVEAQGPEGVVRFTADLTIIAEGRDSQLRADAGLTPRNIGAPIDVLWLRLPKAPSDTPGVAGRISQGRMLVQIDRGDYWQCAFVIAKGGAAALRARGLEAFRHEVATAAPELAERLAGVAGWDEIKLLTVTIDRLERWWRPGLLVIGDAAHAMSPVGGIGINLAVQDAVAAANILGPVLARGGDATPLLARVEARRAWPARATQAAQAAIQRRVLVPALSGAIARPPLPLRLLDRFSVLRRLIGRLIGMGVRPEHVAQRRE